MNPNAEVKGRDNLNNQERENYKCRGHGNY